MAKATNLIYGLIISFAVMGVLTVFLTGFFDSYGVTIPEAHNETLNVLSDAASLDVYIEEQKIQAQSEDEAPKSWIADVVDILGLWFERGIQTVKLIPNILTLITTLAGAGIDSAGNLLGIAAVPLKTMVMAIITVFIILGVLVSALIKKDI